MTRKSDNGGTWFALLVLLIILWSVFGMIRDNISRHKVNAPTRDEWTQFVNYPYEDINDAVAPSITALAHAMGYDSVYDFRNTLIPECINGLTLKPCSMLD